MVQQKIPEKEIPKITCRYDVAYEEFLTLVKEGKISEAVHEARYWEGKIKEVVGRIKAGKWEESADFREQYKDILEHLHQFEEGKILWELGQYCERQDKLSDAIEFYRHVDPGNYYKQAKEGVGRIAAWQLYLEHRGEIKLRPIDSFNYAHLLGPVLWSNDMDEWRHKYELFLEEAYVSPGKPNFNKSPDELKALLGFQPKVVYASPLSNSSAGSGSLSTSTTATTTTVMQEAPQSYRLS